MPRHGMAWAPQRWAPHQNCREQRLGLPHFMGQGSLEKRSFWVRNASCSNPKQSGDTFWLWAGLAVLQHRPPPAHWPFSGGPQTCRSPRGAEQHPGTRSPCLQPELAEYWQQWSQCLRITRRAWTKGARVSVSQEMGFPCMGQTWCWQGWGRAARQAAPGCC